MKLFSRLSPWCQLVLWLAFFLLGLLLTGSGLFLLGGDSLARVQEGYFGRVFGEKGSLLGAVSFILLGMGSIVISIRGALNFFFAAVLPGSQRGQVKSIYHRHYLKKGPRVVVIGGGTGLSVLLRGLKQYTSNITAVVCVTDDGGSSGRLRGEFGILPPGDLRNCLVALADTEPAMENLFNYRFKKGEISGHNLGNLLITAMADMFGSFETAITEASKVLAVRGRVFPSTLDSIVLAAEFQDGSLVRGETNIVRCSKGIKRVFTIPEQSRPVPEALTAILEADAVILGPGSLYTSVIPNLLVPGIVDAIQKSRGVKVYVCNIMTQPGETIGYSASAHLQAIYSHSAYGLVEYIIVNSEKIPAAFRKKYAAEGAGAVEIDGERLDKLGVKTVSASLIEESEYIRHNSAKLAQLIMGQILAQREPRQLAGTLAQYLSPGFLYKTKSQ